jgi:gamma-glutamyltranspeptidase/glutathione hydrolase
MPGQMTLRDLAAYRALTKAPIHSQYKGLDVYGMPVPSSGGIAVAEILNLMKAYENRTGVTTSAVSDVDYLHRFSEASATAFADRNRYVGDVPGVPVSELVSPAFAAERACLFDPTQAQPRPIPFGSPDGSYTSCAPGATAQKEPYEGLSTSHLTATDRWGNVASYTLTIEQTGGSGITVPGYGFLLNNELTDFNFTPLMAGVPDPNLPGPGKRPRSSMSPTILLDGGKPFLAVGSPGGATIITSVSQTILGYLDRGLPLVDAIAAARLSSRNGSSESAEPALLASPVAAGLTDLGHKLTNAGEIGAVTAIRSLDGGRFEAAAETVRRGGGSAMVVRPQP